MPWEKNPSAIRLKFAFSSVNKQIETGFIPPYARRVVLARPDLKPCFMKAQKGLKKSTLLRVRLQDFRKLHVGENV